MKIKTFVFDLGNVLLPFDYSIMIKKLNAISDNLGNSYYRWYRDNYHYHRDFEKGLIKEEEFIELNLKVLDNRISAETFCKFYSEIFEENRKITSLLPIIKNNFNLILLSNTNSIHKKYGWDKYNFITYFDHLVLSHRVKSVKPEKEIYEYAQSLSNSKPDEILYIDDIKDYTDAAEKLGWNTYHFINEDDTFEFLQKKLKAAK
jgi:putative hydrolase of the HAD superfamily